MQRMKILVFFAAAALSLVAAQHRWGDSGHTMGFISVKGGKARHPAVLSAGGHHYTQLVTATVMPPYRGNARIELEGVPATCYEIHLQNPVVNLGLRRLPRLENNTLFGLEPRDRIALWVVITPPGPIKGKSLLAFYDTVSNRSLLKVPFIFQPKDVRNAERLPH